MSERLRACVLCVENGKLLMVRLRDPGSAKTYSFPPGGAIEKGESPAETAVRETLEETGYRVTVDAATETVAAYPFVWNGKTYLCRTHFFRGKLKSKTPEPIADLTDHEGVEWVPLADLDGSLAYHVTLREIIKASLQDENEAKER